MLFLVALFVLTPSVDAADVYTEKNATYSSSYHRYKMTWSGGTYQNVSSTGWYSYGRARSQACLNVYASGGEWCKTVFDDGVKAYYNGSPTYSNGGWHTFRKY